MQYFYLLYKKVKKIYLLPRRLHFVIKLIKYFMKGDNFSLFSTNFTR